jgi:hypothetical protein
LHQTLQRAIQLHQQGKLDQAEPIYEEILAARPSHFAAEFCAATKAASLMRSHI